MKTTRLLKLLLGYSLLMLSMLLIDLYHSNWFVLFSFWGGCSVMWALFDELPRNLEHNAAPPTCSHCGGELQKLTRCVSCQTIDAVLNRGDET